MTTEPLWMVVLREAVAASSLNAVGKQIGYSGAMLSAVLNGKYNAGLDRVQKAVEGGLMGARVKCPIVGDIGRQKCIEHQRAPFAATNPMRVKLYHACRDGCTHSLIKAGDDAGKEPM